MANQTIPTQRYAEMVKQASPGTQSYKTIPMAFMTGGLICVLGQGLIRLYEHLGAGQRYAPVAASCTLIVLPELRQGNLKNILFTATGALLSPTTVQQKESIPGIAHAVWLSHHTG